MEKEIPVLIVSGLQFRMLERHRRVVRTGLSARVAHAIRVGGLATATGRIGVETVVWRRGDQHVVTVNVDIARSRPAPGEIHCVSPLHLIATRTERELPGSWSRS